MAFSDYFSQLVSPPSYLDGIITPEQRKAAQQQSMFQGLLGAGLSYLSQPKNQGYGSAVPYLAKAGLSGLQAAQAPYAQLEKDVLMKQKFDEITRQNQERETLQNAIEQYKNNPNITEAQRLGLDISPKETITSILTPLERKTAVVNDVLVDTQTGLPIYGKPSDKGKASESTDIQLLNRYKQVSEELNATPNDSYLNNEKKAIELKLGLQEKPSEMQTQAEQLTRTLTPAQTEFDKKVIPNLIDFQIKGGFADIQKQVKQLDETIELLKTSPEGDITGKLVGIADQAGGVDYTNPTAKSAQERVQEVAQRNLRLVLGPAFTAKEGENLISRAYNPKLSQAENIKRVENLKKQMLDAAKATQEALDYYTEKGTLQGFEGETYKKYLQQSSQPTTETTTTQTRGAFKEGAKTKSKSGKPMIYTNGQWEYQ